MERIDSNYVHKTYLETKTPSVESVKTTQAAFASSLFQLQDTLAAVKKPIQEDYVKYLAEDSTYIFKVIEWMSDPSFSVTYPMQIDGQSYSQEQLSAKLEQFQDKYGKISPDLQKYESLKSQEKMLNEQIKKAHGKEKDKLKSELKKVQNEIKTFDPVLKSAKEMHVFLDQLRKFIPL